MPENNLIELTAEIVAAQVSNNDTAAADVPVLIQSIYDALTRVTTPAPAEPAKQEPAVSVRASVKPDYIVCLEDGAKLKMLKRYLRTRYDMSPEEYRAKWNLPRDYPMVAPAYAEQRRTLAHSIGLGRKKVAEQAVAATEQVKKTARKAVRAGSDAADKPARKPRAKKAATAEA